MPKQEDTPAFDFLDKVEKKSFKKKGFITQVKEFFKATEGGAIPQPLACKILGISRQRLHQLIKKEEQFPGTGIKAYRFDAAPNVVLVSMEDVDRHHEIQMKAPNGGYNAQKVAQDIRSEAV